MVIGFIGCGNMGGAIIGGIVGSRMIQSGRIIISDKDEAKVEALKEKYNVIGTSDNAKVAHDSDILFICVKPNKVEEVAEKIKERLKMDSIIVSIAAGKKISDLQSYFGEDKNIIRAMPNTPALVGEGMTALSICKRLGNKEYKERLDFINKIFDALGRCAVVPESMMDAVTGISGSSPAYVFMFIEAMADAAVRAGMTRKTAYIFAAQAVLGSAKMVLETEKHPAELKDMVCSPAGTTIDAVKILEDGGFRGVIMDAVDACVKKSSEM